MTETGLPSPLAGSGPSSGRGPGRKIFGAPMGWHLGTQAVLWWTTFGRPREDGSPSPTGSGEQGGGVSRSRSHPAEAAAGKVLEDRGVPGVKGGYGERQEGDQMGPGHAQRGLFQLLLLGRGTDRCTVWPQGHGEAGGALSRCPHQPGGPCTCQGSEPGVRWGPMPGRVLNELLAYLHVLINHKMSPRGSIKLSISHRLLPLATPQHTHTAPHPYTPLRGSGLGHSYGLFPQLQ